MKFTEEQIKNLAENYSSGKSSSSVFKEAHERDFIAGFNKAIEILLALEKSKDCRCSNLLDAENCTTNCISFTLQQYDL